MIRTVFMSEVVTCIAIFSKHLMLIAIGFSFKIL